MCFISACDLVIVAHQLCSGCLGTCTTGSREGQIILAWHQGCPVQERVYPVPVHNKIVISCYFELLWKINENDEAFDFMILGMLHRFHSTFFHHEGLQELEARSEVTCLDFRCWARPL